jgi:hypothetical protein
MQNKLMDMEFCCAQISDMMNVVDAQRQEFYHFYDRCHREVHPEGQTNGLHLPKFIFLCNLRVSC